MCVGKKENEGEERFTLSRWRNWVDEPLIYWEDTHPHAGRFMNTYKNTHTHTHMHTEKEREREAERADSLLEWCFRVIKHSRTLA